MTSEASGHQLIFIISNVLGADRSKSGLQQTSHLHISPIENRMLGLDHTTLDDAVNSEDFKFTVSQNIFIQKRCDKKIAFFFKFSYLKNTSVVSVIFIEKYKEYEGRKV